MFRKWSDFNARLPFVHKAEPQVAIHLTGQVWPWLIVHMIHMRTTRSNLQYTVRYKNVVDIAFLVFVNG